MLRNAFVLALAVTAAFAVVVDPNDDIHIFSADTNVGAACKPWNLINGAGMIGSFAVVSGQNGNECGDNDYRSWPVASADVTLDLGPQHTVYAIAIWNYNHLNAKQSGVKDFEIFTSTDRQTWTSHGQHVLAQAPEQDDIDYSEKFAVTATARYVRIHATSTHQGTGSVLFGLSEVKVYGTRVGTPAPAVTVNANDDIHIFSADTNVGAACKPWNLINGVGMTGNFAVVTGQNGNECGAYDYRSWPVYNADITFDLGPQHTVYAIAIWNFNDLGSSLAGVKDFEIFTSDDRQTWTSHGKHLLARAPSRDDVDYSEKFAVAATTRFIRIAATSTHQGPGQVLFGLSEVKVYGTRVGTPAPAVTVDANDDINIFSIETNVGAACGPWNLINGVGMIGNFAVVSGQNGNECGANDYRSWPVTSADINMDLGPVYNVYAIRIWNFNNLNAKYVGAKDIEVFSSNNGQTWTSRGVILVNPAPEREDVDYSEKFALTVTTRYLKFTIKATHQGPGEHVSGLSQIKVYGTPVSPPAIPPAVVTGDEVAIAAVTGDASYCPPSNLIGNAGLAASGFHDVNGQNGATCQTSSWRSQARTTTSLVFDLGVGYTALNLYAARVWNYNDPTWALGVKELRIETSNDQSSWSLQTTELLRVAPVRSDVDYSQVFGVTGTARYVRLTSLVTHAGTGNREHALSKVKFYAVPATPAPPEGCVGSCLRSVCPSGLHLSITLTGLTTDDAWGDQYYTDDSSVATAAVHAGVLSVGETKKVKVVCSGTQSSFVGSTRNGVTTQTFAGSYLSFAFEDDTRFTTPEPTPAPPGTTPTPPTLPPLAPPCDGAACLAGRCSVQGVTFDITVQGTTSGSAYGTDVYTEDSHAGVAAVHAGLLAVGESKTLTVTCLSGRSSYTGTTRNGVSSNSYGSWPASYSLAITAAPTPPPTPPFTATTALKDACGNAKIGTKHTLRVFGTVGLLWGTDTYTDDSHIGAAALHAGLVAAASQATVVATCEGAQSSFTGSVRNGVTSADWTSSYPGSYSLAARGAPTVVDCTSTLKCMNTLCLMTSSVFTLSVTGASSGTAWGTDHYTVDSELGLVAVHAGLVAVGETKTVEALCTGSHDTFAGTTRNGATTASYAGNWNSFSLFTA